MADHLHLPIIFIRVSAKLSLVLVLRSINGREHEIIKPNASGIK